MTELWLNSKSSFFLHQRKSSFNHNSPNLKKKTKQDWEDGGWQIRWRRRNLSFHLLLATPFQLRMLPSGANATAANDSYKSKWLQQALALAFMKNWDTIWGQYLFMARAFHQPAGWLAIFLRGGTVRWIEWTRRLSVWLAFDLILKARRGTLKKKQVTTSFK